MILTREQMEELTKFDTPTVCNALEQFGLRTNLEGYMLPGLTLRTSSRKPMVGYAVTAMVSGNHKISDELKNQNIMNYYAGMRENELPTIAVIQDVDDQICSSFWGEVQATVHMALGCVGAITQGGVRDLGEVDHLGFTLLSTEICVSHGYTHVEKFQCPVTILGLSVSPGDLLHADEHGVVKIPHEVCGELADACRAAAAAELPLLEPCRAAITAKVKPTLEELKLWRNHMAQSKKKLISGNE